MTIIYEVNLEIEKSLESTFVDWLKTHIEEMLTLDGFVTATLFKELDVEDLRFCVQYKVKSLTMLEAYFANQAPLMRAQGIERFGTKMRASRRVMEER